MSQPVPFPTVRPPEALKIIIADMPPGIARRVVRDALLGFSELDALEWRRMMETEKKRRQREEEKQANVPIASPATSGQRVIVPMSQGKLSGRAAPSTPAPSPGPPSPPTPPPFIPQTPAVESLAAAAPSDDEPDAPPAAAGGQGGKKPMTAAQRAERDAKRGVMLAVGAIMHRDPETRWSDDEKKALAKAYPNITPDTLRRVGAYYTAHWPPGRDDKNILRRDVLRLVRYWGGELDRANIWLARLPPSKRARLLADPVERPPQLPPEPEPAPPPLPTEADLEAAHAMRYRSRVRADLVQGVPRESADDPSLKIPQRHQEPTRT